MERTFEYELDFLKKGVKQSIDIAVRQAESFAAMQDAIA